MGKESGPSGQPPEKGPKKAGYTSLISEFERERGIELKREKAVKLSDIISKDPKYELLRSAYFGESIDVKEGRRLIDQALTDMEYQHLDRVLGEKQSPFRLGYWEDEPVIGGARLKMFLPTANGGAETTEVVVGIKKFPDTDWIVVADNIPLDPKGPSYKNPMDAIKDLESVMGFLTSTPRRCPRTEVPSPFYVLNETGLGVHSVSPTNLLTVKNGGIATFLNKIYAAEYNLLKGKPEGFDRQLAWAQKFPDEDGASELLEAKTQIERYQQEITACNNRLGLEGAKRYKLSDDFLYQLIIRSKTDKKISQRLGTLYTLSQTPQGEEENIKKWLYYFEHLEQKTEQSPASSVTTETSPLVAKAGTETRGTSSTQKQRPAGDASRPSPRAQASVSPFVTTLKAKTKGTRDASASSNLDDEDVPAEGPDGMTSEYFSLAEVNGKNIMTINGMNPQEVRDSRVHDFIGKLGKSAYELGNPENYTLRSEKNGKLLDYTWQADPTYGHTWKDKNNNRLLVVNGTKIEIIPNKETPAVAAAPTTVEAPTLETPASKPLTTPAKAAAPSATTAPAPTPEAAMEHTSKHEFRATSTEAVLDALIGPDAGRFKRRRLLKRLEKKFPNCTEFTLHVHEISGNKIGFDITAKDSTKTISKRFSVEKSGKRENVKDAVFARLMDKKDMGENIDTALA